MRGSTGRVCTRLGYTGREPAHLRELRGQELHELVVALDDRDVQAVLAWCSVVPCVHMAAKQR